jgi:SAM-dependent methyltransferase
MPLPSPASEPATSRLPGAPAEAPAIAPAAQPEVTPAHTMKARVKRVARAVANRVGRRLFAPELDPMRAEAQVTRERIEHLEAIARRFEGIEFNLAAVGDVFGRLNSLIVNQELLKGEIRDVEATLEDLGTALAPGAGLAGAGVRVAELRERVYGLERRLRTMLNEHAPQPVGPSADSTRAGDAANERASQSSLFDYVGFEQRFRGDPSVILANVEKRYADLLATSPPVLDIGCGRGELVGLLGGRGVEAYGIDLDASLVAEANAIGLDVRLADAVSHLESLPPASLGAIVTTHVVEHLELDDLIRVLELAVSRLRPGGVFIAETPNPASLIVLGNSYILDPTHVRPLHPSLLAFLCESAGFREVRLEFFAPAEAYWLDPIDAPDAGDWVNTINADIEKLNRVLFGPQEYAVIARTPPKPLSGAVDTP